MVRFEHGVQRGGFDRRPVTLKGSATRRRSPLDILNLRNPKSPGCASISPSMVFSHRNGTRGGVLQRLVIPNNTKV